MARTPSRSPAFRHVAGLMAAAVVAASASPVALALPRDGMVSSVPTPGAFALAGGKTVAPIVVDTADFPGVARAAGDLAKDIERVTGRTGEVLNGTQSVATSPVLIGTIGKSPLIDGLIKAGKLRADAVAGKWESYVIEVVKDPMPGVAQALVIAGSDKRGTVYGIYDLSENIGVSPWYWWADVPPQKRDTLYVNAGRYEQGPPAVKYRGIFLNDEAPCLTGWARQQFGGLNSKFYTRVFELLLRLRANYMWPAMWGNAFNEDDPDNARLADEYGIVMGTSHQEPMLRAQAEFDRKHKDPAKFWNYATNPEGMEKFWRDGIRRNKNFESIITMGMRGRNDTEMIEGATIKQSSDLLEKIVARQRQILAEEINPDVTKVPQMWCLYKEVQNYYEHGLRVPDDVTLLWAEDNWGNIRRVPSPEERKRPGGAGIYYHFDYVGGPRSYKWLNTNPLPKIQEQMHNAWAYGADRIWIVNVGDLKPMELPIQFFMTMAWNPAAMSRDHVADFTRRWAAQQFGAENAEAVADLVSKYGKYNGWRKPELIDPKTFSLVNYGEADRVEKLWSDLVAKAETLEAKIPAEGKDAYFQLVLHPIKACATVTQMYIAAGRNELIARQGRVSANAQAERVKALFALDKQITDRYHQLGNGKWNHMMSQTHIGFTTWSDPKQNNMPAVTSVQAQADAAFGVAVEGAESAIDSAGQLPAIDSLADQKRWIDVFSRGTKPVTFAATASAPWLIVSPANGNLSADQRLIVSIDWAKAPAGDHKPSITIAGDNGKQVVVEVPIVNDPAATKVANGAFGSLTDAYSIPADAFKNNHAAAGLQWQPVPDYGRVSAAMSVFPKTDASIEPGQDAPCLEYDAYFPKAGPVPINAVIAPTLPFLAGRGLRLSVAIDDAPPVVFDAKMEASYSDRYWGAAVSNNARTITFLTTIDEPGRHTIKVRMVDPGIVLQQLVVGKPLPSYFGPPVKPQAAATARKAD